MDQAQFYLFTQTLTHTLQADDRVLALIAIGSLAHPARVDPWSDHDFWVITTAAAQTDLLTDLAWLPDPTAIVLTLRPAQQYYTVLYATGHIAEFAVFGLHDLAHGRLIDYQILFDKAAITPHIEAIATKVQADQRVHDARHIFAHFLITLCTGSARAARGEALSAHKYIFQYALDALLTLIVHHVTPQRSELADLFEPRRHFELVYPSLNATLTSWLGLPPALVARHMLDLAEQLFPATMFAFAPHALPATRAYLQTLL